MADISDVRFKKGKIAISEERDIPLLRCVLHGSIVTPSQLFEFLDGHEQRMNGLYNRISRLIKAGLLEDVTPSSPGVQTAYRLTQGGANVLIAEDEACAIHFTSAFAARPLEHWIRINQMRIALHRANAIKQWMSRVELYHRSMGHCGPSSLLYNGVITLLANGRETQVAVLFESSIRDKEEYCFIQEKLNQEKHPNRVLFVTRHDHEKYWLAKQLGKCQKVIGTTTMADVTKNVLSARIRIVDRGRDITLDEFTCHKLQPTLFDDIETG